MVSKAQSRVPKTCRPRKSGFRWAYDGAFRTRGLQRHLGLEKVLYRESLSIEETVRSKNCLTNDFYDYLTYRIKSP